MSRLHRVALRHALRREATLTRAHFAATWGTHA